MKTRPNLIGFTKSQFHTQDLAQGIIRFRASEFCSQRTVRAISFTEFFQHQ